MASLSPTHEVLVSRRQLLLVPALIAGLAMPAAPALAGEDPGGAPAPKLHVVSDCVSHSRAKVVVSGDDIDSVAFFISGHLRKRATDANSNGNFVLSMRCRWLGVGAHTARAVVNRSGVKSTLRFSLTRVARTSPRFTG
jgi:hypothetical protein